MQPFAVSVLDKRRTLTEKLVSIIRCSLANNPIQELTAKIRHFYDLHYLLQDKECKTYLESTSFKDDFQSLFEHDQKSFDKPEGWQSKTWSESPLVTDFCALWNSLKDVYCKELPDLSYQKIASTEEVEESVKSIIHFYK